MPYIKQDRQYNEHKKKGREKKDNTPPLLQKTPQQHSMHCPRNNIEKTKRINKINLTKNRE
jgi:hypothetical protein